jgi:hypothetical protein
MDAARTVTGSRWWSSPAAGRAILSLGRPDLTLRRMGYEVPVEFWGGSGTAVVVAEQWQTVGGADNQRTSNSSHRIWPAGTPNSRKPFDRALIIGGGPHM